ncbi:hypothetical protein ACCF55_000052 [Shigella dysenteriae]|nr:hypothetical protein [Shigella dysenteriae]EFZ2377505.1 hypothetical protein [Shigella dysenteriae]HCS1834460.1 hypothetical protein [Shigella dysenteriae]
MSNIDKRATELRERFEAWWEVNYHNGNPPRFGWAAWRDGDGYKIDDDESELDGMWQAWQAAHSGKMEAAEKRIAELEARTLVPVEPTLDQLVAGKRRLTSTGRMSRLMSQRLAEVYRAMVNAAAAGKGEAS